MVETRLSGWVTRLYKQIDETEKRLAKAQEIGNINRISDLKEVTCLYQAEIDKYKNNIRGVRLHYMYRFSRFPIPLKSIIVVIIIALWTLMFLLVIYAMHKIYYP